MDMPTTVPRASITQADARPAASATRSCAASPRSGSVVGKAGRAETPTDPSPLDMIETIINLRDRDLWPKRKLRYEDATWLRPASSSTLLIAEGADPQAAAPTIGSRGPRR